MISFLQKIFGKPSFNTNVTENKLTEEEGCGCGCCDNCESEEEQTDTNQGCCGGSGHNCCCGGGHSHDNKQTQPNTTNINTQA